MKKTNTLFFIIAINLTYNFISMEKKLEKDTNKHHEKAKFYHTKVIRELKEKTKEEKPVILKKEDKKPKEELTQIESFLTAYFILDKPPENYKPFIEKLLKSEPYLGNKNLQNYIKKDHIQSYVDLIEAMRKKENELNNYYSFYHAHNDNSGLLQDIQTAIRKWLFLKLGEKHYLRFESIIPDDINTMNKFLNYWNTIFNLKKKKRTNAFQKVYKKFKDFLHFNKKDFKKHWLGNINDITEGFNDHVEPFKSQILPVNFTPFANVGKVDEGSLYFFIKKSNLSDPKWLIKKIIFEELKFNEKYMVTLENNFKKYMTPKFGGHMLQIFIPKNKVNQFVYLCTYQYGEPLATELVYPNKTALSNLENNITPNKKNFVSLYGFNEEEQRHDLISPYLEKYTTFPFCLIEKTLLNTCLEFLKNKNVLRFYAKNTINDLQGRIIFFSDFFNPENKIKIFRYNFVEEKNRQIYKKELVKTINEMMKEWIISEKYENLAKDEKNIPLIKLLRVIKTGEEYKKTDEYQKQTKGML